jgi:pimeloyl-CoA dehydrogenase large subunit
MDLHFSQEELAFRDEVRAFCRSRMPADLREQLVAGRFPSKDSRVRWARILAEKGWGAPPWPVQYGGTGWGPVKQYIFSEELSLAPAPEPGFGVDMIGPVIYTFGTDAQKERFLPRILTLEDWWCQGFSEPEAGSDLASLRTSAVRDGDSYIVNGQKTWTTGAQHANWMFCLVRTNPEVKKQRGISFLLIDMNSAGISVRPIQTIDGSYEINEVHLDHMRVPAENLIGEENRGWDYAKYLLGLERYSSARVGASKERLRRIRALAARQRSEGGWLIDQPDFRERIAAIEVRLKALEMTQLRVLAHQSRRHSDTQDPASSILKMRGSQIQQATWDLLMEVVGPYALPYRDEDAEPDGSGLPVGPDWAAPIAPAYFNMRKVSIYGGSDEIQRNIIAKAILGL